MAGAVYYFLGIETKGKSIEQIDRELMAANDIAAPAPSVRQA
jgi:putative MFS transporter